MKKKKQFLGKNEANNHSPWRIIAMLKIISHIYKYIWLHGNGNLIFGKKTL